MIKLEHVGICAKDTKTLKDWYVRLFNFKVVFDNKQEEPAYFLLMEDGNMIEIYPNEVEGKAVTNAYQGIRHLAFSTDNIEKEYENLIMNNVELINQTVVNNGGVKILFFKDIEGNVLHFIQREKSLY